MIQDAVYYSHGGDSTDQEYFYISPTTGAITLRKLLSGTPRNTFLFTVTCVDDRPTGVQRNAEARVEILVLRDSGPPQFANTPYTTTVAINQAINISFFTVHAVDNDLKVYPCSNSLIQTMLITCT